MSMIAGPGSGRGSSGVKAERNDLRSSVSKASVPEITGSLPVSRGRARPPGLLSSVTVGILEPQPLGVAVTWLSMATEPIAQPCRMSGSATIPACAAATVRRTCLAVEIGVFAKAGGAVEARSCRAPI